MSIKKNLGWLVVFIVFASAEAFAQHESHKPSETSKPKPSPSVTPAPASVATPELMPSPQASPAHRHVTQPSNPTEDMKMVGGGTSESNLLVLTDGEMGIRIGSSNNVEPMGQMGSGTSWQPITTPAYMIHKQAGDWLVMLHYQVVIGFNSQGGPRGVKKFESANWLMPMALRRVGVGTLQLRAMLSAEPFTFARGGSPLLFQTGESFNGQPLIDRQHPHDLFMELSASYTVPLGDRATWFAYFGYPGEPALGPTAFMHRASASENPSAPLSHHLQDSSHISFGVFTSGVTWRGFKLEGSVFNGREPDENRYNFEAHRWNSRSFRLSFAPNQNWSMQFSHGLLRNPEALAPGDVRRTTASVSYNKWFARGNWASSLIWGRNHENHGSETFNLNGYIAESTFNFIDRNYIYGRFELVDKNALLRDADRQLLGISDHHPAFRIGAYTFGAVRDLWITEKITIGLGGDATLYSKPAMLDQIYGNTPTSYRVYVRMRPGQMKMQSHTH